MIRLDRKQKFTDRRLFFIIFALTFTIFIFASKSVRSTVPAKRSKPRQSQETAVWLLALVPAFFGHPFLDAFFN